MAGGKKVRKVLLRIVGTVIAIAVMALLAASLIIAKPQDGEPAPAAARPFTDASPAVSIEERTGPCPAVRRLPGAGHELHERLRHDLCFRHLRRPRLRRRFRPDRGAVLADRRGRSRHPPQHLARRRPEPAGGRVPFHALCRPGALRQRLRAHGERRNRPSPHRHRPGAVCGAPAPLAQQPGQTICSSLQLYLPPRR